MQEQKQTLESNNSPSYRDNAQQLIFLILTLRNGLCLIGTNVHDGKCPIRT